MRDIVDRYNLKDDVVIDALTDAIYSSVGSLSNPWETGNSVQKRSAWEIKKSVQSVF